MVIAPRKRFQRIAATVYLTAVMCGAAACVDTSAVKKFAAASAEAGDQFETLANDLPASCDRLHRYLALADSQITLDDIRSRSEESCVGYEALASRLAGANKVLVTYLKALGKLADDKLVVYDKRIGDFADALDETEMFDAEKIEAVHGLTAVLANAAAGEWRRKELKKAIERANPDVQTLIEGLRDVISIDYPRLLDVEAETARHYYLGQIKEYGQGEPLTVTLVFDKWTEEDIAITDRRNVAAACVMILDKIARGHQELYDNRDDLSSKQIRDMLLEYTVILEELVEDVTDLRHAF